MQGEILVTTHLRVSQRTYEYVRRTRASSVFHVLVELSKYMKNLVL